MKVQNKTKGFTIIEVVLVLAIAGLIFLMVFLALPALQRSQRDTQRRSDVGAFTSQLTQYQTNNNGAVPAVDTTVGTCGPATSVTCFVQRYLTNWNDPSTGATYAQVAQSVTTPSAGQWKYYPGYSCNGETPQAGAGARRFAIVMKLEGAGSLCEDNK